MFKESKPVSGDGEASHQIEACALSLVSHVHVIALLITHNCILYIYGVWFYSTRQLLVCIFFFVRTLKLVASQVICDTGGSDRDT